MQPGFREISPSTLGACYHLRMVIIDPELDGSTALTRYMPFSKFMDLIENGRTFLPNVAILSQSDRREGRLTPMNYLFEDGSMELLSYLVNQAMPAALGVGERPKPQPRPEPKPFNSVFGPLPITPKVTFTERMLQQSMWVDVQCWHRSTRESVAMWKIYGGGDQSVSISTTVDDLRAALSVGESTTMIIAPITYIDYENEYFDSSDPHALFLHKLDAYKYEQEVRVLAYDPTQDVGAVRTISGRYIECDVKKLVASVRVSPDAQSWFVELVSKISAREIGVPATKSVV